MNRGIPIRSYKLMTLPILIEIIGMLTIAIIVHYVSDVCLLTKTTGDTEAVLLVSAVVKSIGKRTPDGFTPATITITHVYVGDKKLKGEEFTDTYCEQGGNGRSALSAFVIGAEGIWTLKQRTNDIVPFYDRRMPFMYRSRKSDNRRHEQVVALAEAIEKIDKAQPDDRVILLRELAKDCTPEVCAWAVHTLGESKTTTAREYLEGLSRNLPADLPLASQVALDEVLVKTKEFDWTKSKVRSALLESWVKGKPDEYHMNLILRRFDMADQLDELSNKTAIDLTRRASENKEWAKRIRLFAVEQIGRIANRGVNDEPAYTWLFEQVQKNSDVEFRRTAAGTLAACITIYPARLKAIEGHLKTETDKEVIKSLQEAVKKGQDRK